MCACVSVYEYMMSARAFVVCVVGGGGGGGGGGGV